jgi:hypothetical protein
MKIIFLILCLSFAKLYHVIPEHALHHAHARLCEATMDIREGIPDNTLPDEHPLCIVIKSQETDQQRAYAEYRDLLLLYGLRVSYQTIREYQQERLTDKRHHHHQEDIYDPNFCMDIHNLRKIHQILQCKHAKTNQNHESVKNKKISDFL